MSFKVTVEFASDILAVAMPKKVHEQATSLDVRLADLPNKSLVWAITNGLKSGLADAVAGADTDLSDIEAKLQRLYDGTLGAGGGRTSDPVTKRAKELVTARVTEAVANAVKAGKLTKDDAAETVKAKVNEFMADPERVAPFMAQARLDVESAKGLTISLDL